MKRLFPTIAVLALGFLSVTACSDLGYYVQCAAGHWQVMRSCRPIAEVVADPQVSPADRERLRRVVEIRRFATEEIDLPDNNSYRTYADLKRPYVVWNLVAAPEFSLTPKQWCFPVAGCVSYRGYFDREAASEYARELAADGYETDVYGVQAYSTLNWFDDPVLNTFLTGEEARLAALIFHELAHQVVYVPGDSSFNEAFAKTVELEGVRRWLARTSSPEEWEAFQEKQERSERFQAFLADVRGRLATLYQSNLPVVKMRAAKIAILSDADAEYLALKRSWGNDDRYDPWYDRGLNNARLASVATYHELLPAFQALLAEVDHDFGKFYGKVREISRFSGEARLVALRGYLEVRQAKLDQRSID